MKYSSNGKILLTSEYLVLDGAKALALPSKFSQSLEINRIEKKNEILKSLGINEDGIEELIYKVGEAPEKSSKPKPNKKKNKKKKK